MTRIYLDVMGGDNAPACNIDGALEALEQNEQLSVILAGTESLINDAIKEKNVSESILHRITVENTGEIITNHDSPVMAIRQKKDSAQVKGMLKIRNGEADGFVSAGSTGALLAGGMFRLGRIEGIERPAIATLLPNGKGYFCLIDSGANADCRAEYLPQFGLMGSVYMNAVMGIEQPRVGIANIGAEAEKGNALVKEAYPLMENGSFRFVGNVEGRDITGDAANVIVCDGFTGNLLLKSMEGIAGTLMGIIKEEIGRNTRGKIAYLVAKKNFHCVKKRMDYSEVGGAPLLGVNGAVVKAHGSSNAHAIACAIKQCTKMCEENVVQKISDGISHEAVKNNE
ncbi:MAG: phosphate acyltransferase PlsX [Clostridiales bacterium]|nr:phosphate acyltransferase PlsX [Clostridiales bacterium]